MDIRTSFATIFAAARKRRFLCYKDLSDASGEDWSTVRYSINTQLGDIVTLAHWRKWPLLSAIVVNKNKTDSGTMDPKTLIGFINIARILEYPVISNSAFLRSQQESVFDWAAQYPDGVVPELF